MNCIKYQLKKSIEVDYGNRRLPVFTSIRPKLAEVVNPMASS